MKVRPLRRAELPVDTMLLARFLIGKTLVHQTREGRMSGRAPRGRRGTVHEEEPANHERWLVSYADMITVLMALFIVLFAISQVDQDKYIALRDNGALGQIYAHIVSLLGWDKLIAMAFERAAKEQVAGQA